jgi:pyruvate kinase
MILAGMNVARLNFSHATQDEHVARMNTIRELADELRRPIAIMADLQGPKIRVAKLNGTRELKTGEMLTIITHDIPEPDDVAEDELPVRLKTLATGVQENSQIMLADGMIRLRVKDVDHDTGRIQCLIEEGGLISSHKGVNLPGVELDIPSLTEKDINDLKFALDHEVDYIAQSFVRSPTDVEQLRERITNHPGSHKPQIIAKIEKRLAIERLDDILAASDGVMVARGDLGVELGAAEVPLVQKQIIRRAIEFGIPVITATQMLESMIQHPDPTRAEASDVANAVLDGTSATMLSAETAMGDFPVEAVAMLDRIARTVEPSLTVPNRYIESRRTTSIPQAMSEMACEAGELLDAAAIVVLTETGRTVRHVARNRPRRPIVAACRSNVVCRRLALDWGTVPVLIEEVGDTEDYWRKSIAAAERAGIVELGDRVVFTAGTIAGEPGMTNMLKVEEHR